MTLKTQGTATEGVQKVRKSRTQRLLRLILATIDPRAWAHFVKVMNFYNYTHVQELRKAKVSPTANIAPNAGFANAQNIEIGDNVTIGAYCQIWAGPERAKVVIGKDALFAPDVMVTATTYRYNEGAPVTDQAMDEADILIGADCWLGRGATILAGTVLGEGCIVGAHAVVRGEFAPYSILVGNPARVVSERRLPEA
ncbi:acyltransferase [Celeribacter neptunius]|uniref:Acetyltransferase (Isoleucine patch superfamily) n=1 Tax=Celeribacter neptunius TaxID=588602 RepID=A0A1I3SCC2_9RHOB|nr:acyltransferase [Celeribacter neptunius]SFJ56378.1 Acetyltransferase (isoleucine patch superfamily) [Celeribacter neptunius]